MIGDITKEGALDEIVKSTHVVIAAAGPYTKLGGPVVDACVRLRAHYVDLTGKHVLAAKHQEATVREVQDASLHHRAVRRRKP